MISQYDGAKIQQTEKTYEEYKKLWKQINGLYAKSEDFDSVDAKIQVWNEIDETTVLAAPTEVLQDETIVLEDITEKLQKTNIRFEVTRKIEFTGYNGSRGG